MQQDYQILPRRPTRSPTSLPLPNPTPFFTNFYDICINNPHNKIYQYNFQLPGHIEQDSGLYACALTEKTVRDRLRDRIGYLAHNGMMVWGSRNSGSAITVMCKFRHNENQFEFEGLLKPTIELDTRDINDEKYEKQFIQILNSHIKNTMKSLKLEPRGKHGQYFESKLDKNEHLSRIGLHIMRGFRTTIHNLKSGPCLQMDICTRLLQKNNLVEDFNGQARDVVIEKYTGRIVVAKYGTYRNYRIQGIDYGKSPLSTFVNNRGQVMNYVEYFKETYGLNITNLKQPLIKVLRNIRYQIKKQSQKLQEKKQYIYLIPEFVSLTGMTENQREDRQTMQALGRYVHINPSQRYEQCSKIIKKFNESQTVIQVKKPKKLEGYYLERPKIDFGENDITKVNYQGKMDCRGILKQPVLFTDWLFVYSQFNTRDYDDADDAVKLLKKASQVYGVKFDEPVYVNMNKNSVAAWYDEIKIECNKNKKIQIVVFFVNHAEEKLYAGLKRLLTNELHLPSQFIRRKTLRSKNPMSSASNIVIQMNAKAGGAPWTVLKSHNYFNGKQTIYGSFSISKNENGTNTLAFVGTVDNECTKIFSHCKTKIKNKQEIASQTYEDIMISWAKKSFVINNKPPQIIIIYLEGLSLPQIQTQLQKSYLPAWKNTMRKIGTKTNNANYNPEVMFVVANKKINSRFYQSEKNTESTNKMTPQVMNVDSGSVIVQSLSRRGSYDFHLAAQHVTQGTCTPTLFRVAYDTTHMPQQALISFTFEQCFNYYNWQGAVRVPACLQNADKLSKFVSKYVKEDIVESQLTDLPFFL